MKTSAADLLSALTYVEQQFTNWHRENLMTDSQHTELVKHYEHARNTLDLTQDYSHVLPSEPARSPQQETAARELRYLNFLEREVRRHVAEQRLTSGPAELCLQEVNARRGALSLKLDSSRPEPAAKREPIDWFRLILDPKSLQILMACGGALLAIGLIVYLWAVGVFEDPLVMAGVLGTANLGLLGGGALLVTKSQYQTAGRGITLLACLLLPLNLWFYDAQGLVTLSEGGHLWVPALGICVLYAAIARLLKDSLFVYTLVAGVTMTGLLILADGKVERFWEVVAPSTMLVAIGVVCVHVERLFSTNGGPFSRENFGRAFFHAGHVVLGSGLGVLLAGRLTGWFYDSNFASLDWFAIPDVATVTSMKLVALGLVLVSVYTYLYSQLVVDRGGRYGYSALFLLLWGEVISLDLLNIPMTAELVVALTTVTGLFATLVGRLLHREETKTDNTAADQPTGGLAWDGHPLTLLGSIGGLLLVFNRLVGGGVEPSLVVLMLGQAVVSVVAGLLSKKTAENRGAVNGFYILAALHTAAALLVVNVLSSLSLPQRMEIFLTVAGGLMLVAGHLGWRKEMGDNDREGWVTFNLGAGSLLTATPLVFGLVDQRLFGSSAGWQWVTLHEVGVLAIGLTLLGSGILCRIRWTTLVGSVTLATYVLSLLALIAWPDKLQNVAVYMMVGGGLFFGTAVLLSVYRDRLLKMPERIRNGEGVFQVLQWR